VELVVLGSSGWFPRGPRATTSLAVHEENRLIVCDAGTGIAHLRDEGFRHLLPESGEIHLLLSHLHLDHTVGLSFLPALWSNPTVIHVPDQQTTGYPPGEVLDRLIGPPFFPHGFAEFPMDLRIEPLTEGEFEIPPLRVRARRQNHPGGSFGFRIGDRLVFLTDTVYDEGSADFARGARLLVHEAWIRGHEDPEQLKAGLDAHTSAEGAARVARDAGVEELLLSHLTPLRNDGFHQEMLATARAIFPRTYLCSDGLSRLL